MPSSPTPTWAPELLARAYYSDDSVILVHGDCREVLAGMGDASVDAVMTDPPYTERTHAGARSNSSSATDRGRVLSGNDAAFAAITDADLAERLAECGRISRGWVIATLAYQHAFAFDMAPPVGLRCLRIGVWVKSNPMPQISGDRPAQGWEAIAYLHRDDTKPQWSGGGKAGNYVAPVQQGQGHPTVKPMSMLTDWVAKFTHPGDVILDPFAGSGTTLRAAKDDGRRAIGVELEERYCEIAAKRLAQDAFDFGGGE